jgi:hypothetical protein
LATRKIRGGREDDGDLDGGIGEGSDGIEVTRGSTWRLRKSNKAWASNSVAQRERDIEVVG